MDLPTPDQIPIRDRLRRLPGAVLLTAGYFLSRSPVLSNLIRRRD
ncbi:MAG: hypothetical protein ACJ75Z_10980 [Solirubrobacterales bacterium]